MPRKLRNIRLSEISIVDKAANKTKFYFVKSADSTEITTADITGVMKTLLGMDPPDDFTTNVDLLDDESKRGYAALLAVADEYSDALPEALSKSFGQMAMAAVQPDDEAEETDVDKATAARAAALRVSGNQLIKDLEKLLEKARGSGGSIRYYAQSLVTLADFVSTLKWLIDTGEERTDQPAAPEKTGLGTQYPIGKRVRVRVGKKPEAMVMVCPVDGKKFRVKAGDRGAGMRCPVHNVPLSREVSASADKTKTKKLMSKDPRKWKCKSCGKTNFSRSSICSFCEWGKSKKKVTAKAVPPKCPKCGQRRWKIDASGGAQSVVCQNCGNKETLRAWGKSAKKKLKSKLKKAAVKKAATTCPKCKKAFKPKLAKDGKVICPHCKATGTINKKIWKCSKCKSTLVSMRQPTICSSCGARGSKIVPWKRDES